MELGAQDRDGQIADGRAAGGASNATRNARDILSRSGTSLEHGPMGKIHGSIFFFLSVGLGPSGSGCSAIVQKWARLRIVKLSVTTCCYVQYLLSHKSYNVCYLKHATENRCVVFFFLGSDSWSANCYQVFGWCPDRWAWLVESSAKYLMCVRACVCVRMSMLMLV